MMKEQTALQPKSWKDLFQAAEALAATDRTQATDLYHRALAHAIAHKSQSGIEEVWLTLVDYAPQPLEPFLEHAQNLLAKNRKDATAQLLSLLLPVYQSTSHTTERIQILQLMNQGKPDEDETRSLLCETYQKGYADVEQIDTLIRRSGLRGKTPIAEACTKLERFLNYRVGQCVLHYGWGVGVVTELDTLMGKISIDFPKKPGHTVELDTLDTESFTPLEPEDLRTLIACRLDEARQWVENDPVRLVKAVLRATGGQARNTEIKNLLVDQFLSEKQWSSWWASTNHKLKDDPFVEITGKSAKKYQLCQHAIDPVEHIRNTIDNTPRLPEKLAIWCDWINSKECIPEVARELAEQLVNNVDKKRHPEWLVELAYTLDGFRADEKFGDLPQVPFDPEWEQNIELGMKILTTLHRLDYQQRFGARLVETIGTPLLEQMTELLVNPDDDLRELGFYLLNTNNRQDLIAEVWKTVSHHPRQMYAPYVWFAWMALQKNEMAELLRAHPGTLLDACLHLLHYINFQAKLEQDKDVATQMRKVGSRIRDIFRKERIEMLKNAVDSMSEAQAKRVAGRVFHESPLDDPSRKRLLNAIYEKYPNVETALLTGERTTDDQPELSDTIECLMDTINAKRDLLRHLIEVEIPENTRAIETARAHGDLRENAEYKAAKEDQRLLHARAQELEEALESAIVRDLDSIAGEVVEFGTRVKVQEDDALREYVILGPWEADSDTGVLNHQAPMARAMLGKSPGDEVVFAVANQTRKLKILEVAPLKTWSPA